MPEPAQLDQTTVRPARRPKQKQRANRQPRYSVVLHNDDLNSFPFVIECLRKVFGYAEPKASLLTLVAHNAGSTRVWSGTRELAELKAEQLVACGPDPEAKSRGAAPLSVTVEPMPGD